MLRSFINSTNVSRVELSPEAIASIAAMEPLKPLSRHCEKVVINVCDTLQNCSLNEMRMTLLLKHFMSL